MWDDFTVGMVWGLVLGLAAGIGGVCLALLLHESSEEMLVDRDIDGSPQGVPQVDAEYL